MAGSYEKCIYNQLMEVMARLDTVEKEHKADTIQKISSLKEENRHLRKENKLLRDDNARLKRIIHNDSSSTSLPPSAAEKGGRPSNTYNGREKLERKAGGQKVHKGITLTKEAVLQMKKKICFFDLAKKHPWVIIYLYKVLPPA